jgi:hypothetical protein
MPPVNAGVYVPHVRQIRHVVLVEAVCQILATICIALRAKSV